MIRNGASDRDLKFTSFVLQDSWSARSPHRPPEFTLTARFFVRLVDRTALLTDRAAWAVSIGMIVATVVLDHLTNLILSLSFLYLITTAVAVWCLGERKGLLLAIVGVIVGAIIRHFDFADIRVHGLRIGLGFEIWGCVTRIISISIVAVVVNGLRVALALERWRASSDGLTGALNKGAFQAQARIVVDRARAEGQALVLAYMDLDGFKSVNDRHGHSAGDHVLRAFATAAAKAIRDTDLFARIGGDEFVALMMVRDCDEGDQVAEMLHGRLSAILDDTGFKVTCSMGALVTPSEAFDLDGSDLELADMLMYEVKRSGKDALRIARGGGMGVTLRSAYPIAEGSALADILARIDRADEEHQSMTKRPLAI